MIHPGEIDMADFPEAGRHPVIVVSREELNRGNYVLTVFCTSARYAVRSKLPNCVPYATGRFGFAADCVAQCENVLSIERSQLDLSAGPIGILDASALRDVIRAIGYVLEADCEPV